MSLESNHKVVFFSNFSNNSNNKIEIFLHQIEHYKNHYLNLGKTCDIKDMLVENLQNLKIKCVSRNIKLFDMHTQNEIKTINDLQKNQTKLCKIIIIPIQCNDHNLV
jgi:hypothetical protein